MKKIIKNYRNPAKKCREVTACDALMIGRGALNVPNLSKVVKYNQPKMAWNDVLQLLFQYVHMENELDTGFYHVARIKQWLRYLDKEYPEAVQLFDILKTEHGYEGLKQHKGTFHSYLKNGRKILKFSID